MANNYCAICPTDCTGTINLPILDANQNCTLNSTVFKSQIVDFVLLKSTATKPTAMTAAGFLPIIDNTDTTGAKAKHLGVRGGMPAPARTLKDVAKRKQITTSNLYTLTLAVDNLSDVNYAYLLALQCGNTDYVLWYATESHIFGGVVGIQPKSISVEFIYDAGLDSDVTANIIITIDSKCDPARAANPIP